MSELDEALKLGQDVQQLRITYEQYFAGVERFEPLKERERVKKELRRLMGVRSNNTAYKFRLQTLQATLVTHETHWDRIARQIEEGTFKRDKLKAQRHLAMMRDMTNEVELIEDEPQEIAAADAYEALDPADALAALQPDDGESAVRDLLSRGLLKSAPPVAAAANTAKPTTTIADTAKPTSTTAAPSAATPTAATPSAVKPQPTAAVANTAKPTPTTAVANTAKPTPTTAVASAAKPTPTAAVANTAKPTPTAAVASAAKPTPTAAVANTAKPTPTAAVASTAKPTPTAAAKPATPPRENTDPLDLRKLHEAFVAARTQTGETRPVSMETLAETIRKQSEAVKAQLGCERVDFKVAIKDGKAVLKAIPK